MKEVNSCLAKVEERERVRFMLGPDAFDQLKRMKVMETIPEVHEVQ
jgi:hypothetical protein